MKRDPDPVPSKRTKQKTFLLISVAYNWYELQNVQYGSFKIRDAHSLAHLTTGQWILGFYGTAEGKSVGGGIMRGEYKSETSRTCFL